jgi:hypothetical protein
VYPDNKMLNKTTHWLITKFQGAESDCSRKHVCLQTLLMSKRKCRFLSVRISQRKEIISITHEDWRNWNITVNRSLPTVTQKHLAKLHEAH